MKKKIIPQKDPNEMVNVWSGKTRGWDDILETFSNQGIIYKADNKKWTVKVARKDYNNAYDILCEINQMAGYGW